MFKNKLKLAAISATSAAALGSLLYLNSTRKYHELSLDNSSKQRRFPAEWAPPSRQHILERLSAKDAEYDLLIVGGGATGTGIAVDAASRGLKVAMVERDDFASGTSSKSTKLVHGGVRYLEKAFWKADINQYHLVQEALSERYTFLKIAPHLSSELPIMCPVYQWYMAPYYWAGCKAYDFVAGKRGLHSSYYLSATAALAKFPTLKAEGLFGAVVYYDGQQNDSRMNVSLALTAIGLGADVANHVQVENLLKSKDGKINGAVVRDTMTGKSWPIKAKVVVNATGPFTDSLRKMDEPETNNIVVPSAGTHLILPQYICPDDIGLVDPSSSDGRVIFVLPWEGSTIVGTTDVPMKEVPVSPESTNAEVEFILQELRHYLREDISLEPSDVKAAWSGIRPLVKDPHAKADSTAGLVRSHLIYTSASGLLTVTGGKWTTYRKMAEEAVDMAINKFDLAPKRACETENILVCGAEGYTPSFYIELIKKFRLDTKVAKHLAHNYGDRALEICQAEQKAGRKVQKRLHGDHPFLEAEVRYCCRSEYALTINDMMARRTRLAFLDSDAANECVERVIEIMAEELKWSASRVKEERKRWADSVRQFATFA